MMIRKVQFLVVSSILIFSAKAQELFSQPMLDVISSEEIVISETGDVDFHINIEVGSRFESNYLDSAIRKTQLSLNTCGISLKNIILDKIVFHEPEVSEIIKNESPYKPPMFIRILDLKQKPKLPTAYLIKSRRNWLVAKAYIESSVAILNQSSQFDWSPLENVIIMNDRPDKTPYAQPSYSTLAHELVHVLGDVGHISSETPNLMNNLDKPKTKNHSLNTQQCSAIKARLYKYQPKEQV